MIDNKHRYIDITKMEWIAVEPNMARCPLYENVHIRRGGIFGVEGRNIKTGKWVSLENDDLFFQLAEAALNALWPPESK